MDTLKFYGTRGSRSLISPKYMEFGGATTCVLLKTQKTNIMIDCGSGINDAIDDLKSIDELHLFISHTHLDHISGITTLFAAFSDKPLHVYGKSFNGVTISKVIENFMSRSLWPVRANSYKNVSFHELEDDFGIGDVWISSMDSNHPGGCSLFRIKTPEKSYVTAFDFCHLNGFEDKLVEFAKDADVMIYDGTFNQEELQKNADWGHSTPEDGVRIAEKANVKELLITHFGKYDDEALRQWEKSLQEKCKIVKFARSGRPQSELEKMVEIGTMLSGEKDQDLLLNKIVESCMEITNADGGTLYLLENKKLEFKVLINKSKNIKQIRKENSLDLPSIPLNGKNSCAEAAREKRLINIPNIYDSDEYDFSGAKVYDKLNDYLTKSIIVIPLVDSNNDVVGVLQLINAKDENDKIVSFRKKDEDVLTAIANQASVAITNSAYSKQIDDLLYGFVKVMSVQIDERTPYNANHTKNMAAYAEKFFDYEEANNGPYMVDFRKRREIIMSVWLHDIGKILTPLEVMNKDSRLGKLTEGVNYRFQRRELLLKLKLANKEIDQKQYEKLEQERVHQFEVVSSANKIGFIDEKLRAEIDEISAQKYEELDGSNQPVLTEEEHYMLSIVKGTLSKEERLVVEGHVSYTQKFLSQLSFPKYYDKIPVYAGNHHEFLNGSGYPNHLVEKGLPWPGRLITVFDIFEALVAKDRPYKKPFSPDDALNILVQMADKGQLDRNIVVEFAKSKCWEN